MWKKKDVEKWYNNVDWKNINEEKTTLAYDNGMAYLEDLDQSQKNLDNKALVFLSYLFTICGVTLYNLLFQAKPILQMPFSNNMDLSKILLILSLAYAILFCLTALVFLSTQRRKNRFASPKDILFDPNAETQHIKNDICIGLQEAIAFNLSKQNRRALLLKLFLLISVIFPGGLITYCMTNFSLAAISFTCIIILSLFWLLFRYYP